MENREKKIITKKMITENHRKANGCGVFANPPELVASAFNNVAAEFKYHFKTIEFAVYTTDKESRNYKAFTGII